MFDDVSFCRGYRDDFGTPLNMKGRKFSDVWKKKAQEGQEKMIMNDVNKILNTVSEHFRDYLVNKKMRQGDTRNKPFRGRYKGCMGNEG